MVKIKSCSATLKGSPEEWYKDKIGEDFEIHSKGEYYHWVKTEKGINVVNVNDVEV